ncbi:MAG: hypothetical protein HY708_01265 [Ignavibacteriae bacterium]|nr:hypothetical protein [Ignavibacteriota bacterium]
MKPIFVRVVLFDPTTDEEFPIFDGIEVEVARLLAYNPVVGFDILRLMPDPDNKIFQVDAKRYKTSRAHYFRVGFAKRNFSKTLGRLLAPNEVMAEAGPIYSPSRLPYWDSGWDDNYETNEFFDGDDATFNSSPVNPQTIRIPMRKLYIIGHRGAPHFFPENTMASFRKALELGANALEFDLCLTKDKQIAVFHDPEPVRHPSNLDRTAFESLPYELVSPEFSRDGRYGFIKQMRNGEYEDVDKVHLRSETDFDIDRLTLKQVRQYYKYHHVQGTEHEIPELEGLLAFAHNEVSRLHLLFFDVKNPDWDEETDRKRFVAYGRLLGEKMQMFSPLPERLIVTNASEEVLTLLKEGIKESGETRCEFAYDAQGGIGPIIGVKEDPLSIARMMGNSVVSIGRLLRPGNLGEISDATRDRDYNTKSEISTVIHWTLNEPSQIYVSLTAGVNGIVTDKPDEMVKLLEKLKVVASGVRRIVIA